MRSKSPSGPAFCAPDPRYLLTLPVPAVTSKQVLIIQFVDEFWIAVNAVVGRICRTLRVVESRKHCIPTTPLTPRRPSARLFPGDGRASDRKSTRLNSSHLGISY